MQHEFDRVLDGSKRPAEYGKVTILDEDLFPGTPYSFRRPARAYGLIYLQATTAGRKTAPEPDSGFRVGMTKKVPKSATEISLRNLVLPDVDKGHIIALELGGPDVKQNIVPQ